MKRFGLAAVLAVCVLMLAGIANATPSTLVWIPSTDIQKFGSFHLGVDNYNTLGKKMDNHGRMFPTDYGLTVGILPDSVTDGKWGIEVGADMFEASDYPWQFNAKIGLNEGAFGDWSPSIAIGGMNMGSEKDVTDYNIGYGLIAKTFGDFGRFTVGGYTGNDKLLLDADGDKDASGVLAGWDKQWNKDWWTGVDFMSGKNSFSAASLGVGYALSEKASFIVGYVFMLEHDLGGKDANPDMMTFQLDVNF